MTDVSYRPTTTLLLLLVLAGCGGAAAGRSTTPRGDARPPRIIVSAVGLEVPDSDQVPDEVLEVARQGRPRSMAPAFAASVGVAPGPRVFWVAYVTSPFLELQARAIEEGRGQAFEDDLQDRFSACEESADVSDCEYCISTCWESVPNAMAATDRTLTLVRVSWPAGGAPVVDGDVVLWAGTLSDTTTGRVRGLADLDRDGRPELSLEVETGTQWPAGDGGSTLQMLHVVDGDTLGVQLSLLELYEEDGHEGGLTMRTETRAHDHDGDGVEHLDVRFVREVTRSSCDADDDGELDDDADPECGPLDRQYRAIYSREEDAFLLPPGERWPWD